MAAPNVVMLAAQVAINVLEAYFVGWLGADALAGVSVTFPLLMLMQTMSAGGMGGGVASALAAAATVTSQIKLGTAIAVAFPRSPMVLAHIAWDLQRASRGRFVLGLGTQVKGHNERRFSVRFESPGPKMREIVLALRAIWDGWQNGTKLDFKGRFYRFDLMRPVFNPGPIEQPRIPVYVAGVHQYMCRIAGEVCDGLHVHPYNSPKDLREYVQPAVNDGLHEAGRKRGDFVYATSTFVVVVDTEPE